jgi:hypothetical protein
VLTVKIAFVVVDRLKLYQILTFSNSQLSNVGVFKGFHPIL